MPVSNVFWDGQAELLYRILFPVFVRMAKRAARSGIRMLVVEVGVNWALVNEAVIAWATRYTAEVVAQITRTSMDAFVAEFGSWVRSGQPLDALIDALTPYYGPIRAEMVAVTEVTRAFAQGNILGWKQSGVVDGVRWMTGEDDLVCEICAPLEGQVGTLDDGIGGMAPPAHVRCRCYLQPVVNVV